MSQRVVDSQLRQHIAARVAYYRELGIYDFYRREGGPKRAVPQSTVRENTQNTEAAASSGRIENMLTINVESISEVVVLRCSGRLVCGHETALCSAMQQKSRNLVVDLTEVDAIDAAGVGALLSLQAAGVYLKLRNPSRQVREILKVTRLNSIFEICESQSIDETKPSMQERRSDNQSERFTFASSLNA